jgi:hypothetical protein
LPKRERQTSRAQEGDAGQSDFFPAAKPLPQAASVSPVLSYKALLEDYGPQLGKKLRLDANLKLLERHGFILRRQDEIAEGPLLDVLLDYDVLAPRILDGALAEVLVRERVAEESEPNQPPAPDHQALAAMDMEASQDQGSARPDGRL